MRISGSTNVDVAATSKITTTTQSVENSLELGIEKTTIESAESIIAPLDNSEETKQKVQEAVSTMNEILEANHNTSKFVYHEGLNRYYVTVVDKDTDEVVKEIPPRKLLDAFYEMQKMVGMIVDEKI